MIYGVAETDKQRINRQFGAICRAWYAQTADRRKPERDMLEVGMTEFGLSRVEAETIRKRVNDTVYRGVTSDVLMELNKDRPQSWEWGTDRNPLLEKAA